MLEPKRTKYRKNFRVRKISGIAQRGNRITHGEYALMSIDTALVNSRQIEAARRVMVRETKRRGKIWVKIFPDRTYTAKPAEVKMGKGKGDLEGYAAVVKPGRILFEISGVSSTVAVRALSQAAQKLPVRAKVLTKGL